MEVSVEEERVKTLMEMFPNVPYLVIQRMLRENRGSTDAVTDQLLALENTYATAAGPKTSPSTPNRPTRSNPVTPSSQTGSSIDSTSSPTPSAPPEETSSNDPPLGLMMAEARSLAALAESPAGSEVLNLSHQLVGAYERLFSNMESQTVQQSAELEALKSQIAEKDSRISTLESELEAAQAELEKLRAFVTAPTTAAQSVHSALAGGISRAIEHSSYSNPDRVIADIKKEIAVALLRDLRPDGNLSASTLLKSTPSSPSASPSSTQSKGRLD